MTSKQLQKAGTKAVRELRRNKLNSGIPFMINTDLLPTNQCYMEYPDGSINILTICSKTWDFKVIGRLSIAENKTIRRKLKLNRLKTPQ